jgi:menaquinone-specific isochorismate synthase
VNQAPEIPTLRVVTEEFVTSHSLLDFLDEKAPLLCQRHGKGLVGQGIAVEATFYGDTRFSDASAWWQAVRDAADVTDPLHRPGTGLVGFSKFAFSSDSARTSGVVIPAIVIGRDDNGWWLTRVGDQDSKPIPSDQSHGNSPELRWESSPLSESGLVDAVSELVSTMSTSSLHKVVLSRQLVGNASAPLSMSRALIALETSYPDTHLYAMGGFFGASPETLSSVRDNTLSLRVLAGSAARGSDPDSDRQQASVLTTSTKDLDEHEYAVSNVVDSLSKVGLSAVVDETPQAMKLPNLWHLATNVRATLPEGTCALDLIGALHPTAAIAGTPTTDALDAIARYEPFDRGYFAGPIGWLDGDGNAEFAIALRCAELSEDRMRVVAHAGAGIVKNSDPQSELLETSLKFRPIVESLTNR